MKIAVAMILALSFVACADAVAQGCYTVYSDQACTSKSRLIGCRTSCWDEFWAGAELAGKLGDIAAGCMYKSGFS
jgi:purine nucleoside permease